MDYGGGSELAKWQWDYLYDPGIVLRLFEKDKDAMLNVPFNSFKDFEEVVTVYLNWLFNWALKEGYQMCMEQSGRNLTNAGLNIYKPDQISTDRIKYINKLNLMGVNEYSEEVEVEIPNYKSFKILIELIISNIDDANRIQQVIYIGHSTSMIHGKSGYFYLLKSINNRSLGTIRFSEDDYDIFSVFLKNYKIKGYDMAIKDLMLSEPQQAQELKDWGDKNKIYLKYNNVFPVKTLVVKRVRVGNTFQLQCE